jgi:hypothetical protein
MEECAVGTKLDERVLNGLPLSPTTVIYESYAIHPMSFTNGYDDNGLEIILGR